MKICICGGGNIAHVLCGILGANSGVSVNLLTRNPQAWNKNIGVFHRDREWEGTIDLISDDPEEVVSDADLIIIAAPAFAHQEILKKISSHVKKDACLCSLPGNGCFNLNVERELGDIKYFGSNREPFICRVINYGQSVNLLSIRPEISVGTSTLTKSLGKIINDFSSLIDVPIKILSNYISVTLTPGNQLFHTSRLFSLFKDYEDGMSYNPDLLFYKDWDSLASYYYYNCDLELHKICDKLHCDTDNVRPIFEHYRVKNLKQLTTQIARIPSLTTIKVPLIRQDEKYLPDFNSRFFREDIPFGLLITKSIAEILLIKTPFIDELLTWAGNILKEPYLDADGKLTSFAIENYSVLQHFGINSSADYSELTSRQPFEHGHSSAAL